uniref:Uncharacterized protein n=1 Tax=Acrobeloides nanus TaxID=290746 RepID=A0A914DZE1_9BILA
MTPLGRLLNRLGKDIETIDLQLPVAFRMLMLSTLSVIQVLIVVSISTPLFIIVAILMIIFYIWILRYYISTARQLQRLISINRSPIFAYFSESVQGASSIRAYNAVSIFFNNFCEKVNTFINIKYASQTASRWLAVRLELIGNGVVLAAALLSVFYKGSESMTAGVIGLSVSYSLNITLMLNMLIRQLSDVETNIVSVERIKEYSETENEAEWKSANPEDQPPPKWPIDGVITFVNYSTRYRPELELSLCDINVTINANEKIGVAGRTGAGKSSMALALFRIIEPASGQIIIDGIDISKIGLHELRSRITIIPQDPVLFSGTLRFNLDPFNEYSDGDLWSALEYAHLKAFFKIQQNGLYHVIAEGGENISIGQRQLVCLARAILRKSRILVLDEATASIDVITDSLIQRTIQDQFQDSTIITIAHRIHTIIDYDRIMVLDHGKVVEFDSPKNLMANKKSLFHFMVHSQE